jgi:DNA-binding transcriptional ArsR family regulator
MTTGAPTREKIPHPAVDALDLATIMRALGDPARLEIVRLLADGKPRLCGEIYATLGVPNSTGSYHLRTLREAGLTRARPAGTQRYISLRHEDLDQRFPGLVDVVVRRASEPIAALPVAERSHPLTP